MIELLKNDCIVSKLKKAVFVPPFLIVTLKAYPSLVFNTLDKVFNF